MFMFKTTDSQNVLGLLDLRKLTVRLFMFGFPNHKQSITSTQFFTVVVLCVFWCWGTSTSLVM